MKRLFLTSVVTFSLAVSISAQSGKVVFGASPSYDIPIGLLNSRFTSSLGAVVFAGGNTSEDWSWYATFSYNNFSKLNDKKLVKKVEVQTGLDKKVFQFPLTNLSMELKTASLMAEANYQVINTGLFKSYLTFGFGFTKWSNKRESFKDSLFADVNNTGQLTKISSLNVPENKQEDWSGTIKAGITVSVTIAEPVEIFSQFNYKLIIGELWPALALDMENVSGLQFLQISIGLKGSF